MEKTRLRDLLQKLHGELESAESIEPEARDLLREVMDDIQGKLDRTEGRPSEEDGADSDGSISDRLNRAVVEFENSHPQVAFAVKRLLKSLTDIGI